MDLTKTQKCNRCAEIKPLTPEFFRPEPRMRVGFNPRCRLCMNAVKRENHIPKGRLKTCRKCAARLPASEAHFPMRPYGLSPLCVACTPDRSSKTRVCQGCAQELPLNASNYAPQGVKKGFGRYCHACRKKSADRRDVSLKTGKICSKCTQRLPLSEFHKDTGKISGIHPRCKECVKISSKSYYSLNQDRLIQKARNYYAENTAVARQKQQARRKDMPGHYLALSRKYEKGRVKKYNPAVARAAKAKRRALERAAQGSYSSLEWERKLAQYAGRCHWCTKEIAGTPHADHLIPLSKGGNNDIGNIVPSCSTCNWQKGPKLPHEFMGRLL